VPRLCELYPGICLTTEGKAWKILFDHSSNIREPTPVAELSKAWVWDRSLAGTVGSILAGCMVIWLLEVSCFSGRGLCDGLITRLEEFY
jgi:hypothetical protein